MSIYTEAARDVLVGYREELSTAVSKGALPARIQHLDAAIKVSQKIVSDLTDVIEKAVALSVVQETRTLLDENATVLVGDEADMKTVEAAITACIVIKSKIQGMA